MVWYFYFSLVNVFVPCISGYIANYYRIVIQINPTCRYLCTGGLKGCPRVLVPPPDLETVCSKQFWNLDNQLYRALILKMKKKRILTLLYSVQILTIFWPYSYHFRLCISLLFLNLCIKYIWEKIWDWSTVILSNLKDIYNPRNEKNTGTCFKFVNKKCI